MNEAYKPLGLIAISVTWLTIGFMVYKWRGNRGMTISKHAAAFKPAYLIMGIVETIVLPMFFVFISKWFTPMFHLPGFFTVCMGVGTAGLLIAAWIPDTKGW